MNTTRLQQYVNGFCERRTISLAGSDELAAALREAVDRIYELQQKVMMRDTRISELEQRIAALEAASQPAPVPAVPDVTASLKLAARDARIDQLESALRTILAALDVGDPTTTRRSPWTAIGNATFAARTALDDASQPAPVPAAPAVTAETTSNDILEKALEIGDLAREAQGEWRSVTHTNAPLWTHPFKQISELASEIEAQVLEPIEPPAPAAPIAEGQAKLIINRYTPPSVHILAERSLQDALCAHFGTDGDGTPLHTDGKAVRVVIYPDDEAAQGN